MRIAVCDDEKVIREQIEELVRGRLPDADIHSYETGDALLAGRICFDLIFLDIQMEGISGIDAAKILRKRNAGEEREPVLIFITGIKEYVFEAFDVSAFHYLLKPLKEGKFTEVLERALKEVEKSVLSKASSQKEQLFFRTGKRTITVEKGQILYIESRKRKAEIHTQKEMLEIYATMNKLEEQLGEGFYRCHRGYLINMAYITEYTANSITLRNGDAVILAKEKYNEFVKKYMRYLRDGGIVCV